MKMLKGNDVRKWEYVRDVFKGTCELNCFEEIRPSGSSLEQIVSKLDEGVRVYYEEIEKAETKLVAVDKTIGSVYSIGELVNLGAKTLMNLDVEDVVVTISGKDDKKVDDLLANLDMISLVAEKGKDSKSDTLSFTISVEDKPVFKGSVYEEYILLEGSCEAIVETIDFKDNAVMTDAYISPLDEEVLDDAFAIGTNLRDAGFKVEVDYSLKQVTKDDVKAAFLITFDKKDITKYQVKLIDMATKELKTVMIDNLVEELAFI